MAGGAALAGLSAVWSAISSIWSVISTVWGAIKQVWGVVKKAWDFAKGMYDKYVKPLWDKVHKFYDGYVKPWIDKLRRGYEWLKDKYDKYVKPAIDWLYAKVKWLDQKIDWVYDRTLGLIDKVYNKTIGRIEAVWRKFENIRDRILRLIALVDKKFAQKLYRMTEEWEQKLFGWARRLRDEITHKIFEIFNPLQRWIKGFRAAIEEVLRTFQDVIVAIGNRLRVEFDDVHLISKYTSFRTADEYGNIWYKGLYKNRAPEVTERDVTQVRTGAVAQFIDEMVEVLDKGNEGSWADLWDWIKVSVFAIDQKQDPPEFRPDPQLLSAEDRKEMEEVGTLPSSAGGFWQEMKVWLMAIPQPGKTEEGKWPWELPEVPPEERVEIEVEEEYPEKTPMEREYEKEYFRRFKTWPYPYGREKRFWY